MTQLWICLFTLYHLPSFSIEAFQDQSMQQQAEVLLRESEQLLKAGKTRQAQNVIHQARQLQNTLAQQYLKKGINHIRWHEPDSARVAFQSALEYNFNDAQIHLELGKLLIHQQKYDQAVSHLNKSLTLDPTLIEATTYLNQIVADFYSKGYKRTFDQYSIPCQMTTYEENDSLRVEIAYALPKIGLTRSGGLGTVHIDEIIQAHSSTGTIRHTTRINRLPEHGKTTIEKNYLLATKILRIPISEQHFQLEIEDYKIGSHGKFESPIIPPAQPFQLGLSTPLLARNISLKNDTPSSRKDFKIQHNPLRLYTPLKPVFVYVEMYHLLPNSLGYTDYELSYHIQWASAEEIKPEYFEALDTQLSASLPEALLSLRYLVPHKQRNNLTVKPTPSDKGTRITVPYMGKEENDRTYLEIDISDLSPGVHKLALTLRDNIAEESVTRTTLFRVK